MNAFALVLVELALVLGLSSAPTPPAAPPRAAVTEVRVLKSEHRLELLAGEQVLKTYRVAIGSGGAGPKRFEGDRTTPVGIYRITGRWRSSSFHRFLHVSYPNEQDRRRYADLLRKGEVPAGAGIGSAIGIHGIGGPAGAGVHKENDWTHGCIALDDAEIDEIARLVPDGTRLVLLD